MDRHLLFIFLDGVGLGVSDPQVNPLAAARMPVLSALLGGQQLVRQAAPYTGQKASLLALDANLGVPGLPQSATGQAVLLTGENVPLKLGYHYGPKPNPEVAAFIQEGNLFGRLQAAGRSVAFLNAYPPRYFDGIDSGRRLYSAIPLAAVSAGLPLKTTEDMQAGLAISADFTGQGWRDFLGIADIPVRTPQQAGQLLAKLAQQVQFSFFEYWLSDYAGHKQKMDQAVTLLESFDAVLDGLLQSWDFTSGLVLITSDHGNLEDLGTRRHTPHPVLGIVIGDPVLRQEFTRDLHDLTGVFPAVLRFLLGSE